MTWPDCSPPSTRSRRSSSSITLRSPTGHSIELDAVGRERPPEAEVRHHGGDDRVAAQQPAVVQVDRADGEHLVAVDLDAVLVDRDDPVGVAVERQTGARVRLAHRVAQLRSCRWSRSARLMLVPSGAALQHVDVGAERAERGRRAAERRAVAAVDDHVARRRAGGPRARRRGAPRSRRARCGARSPRRRRRPTGRVGHLGRRARAARSRPAPRGWPGSCGHPARRA